MSLPAPNLDDLRFQSDIVDEARKRIVHYCPEWTEYNLSDPGITLIEMFAWMTEIMVYRLNQVPEKNYLKFLEMLGVQRQAASSARADLTFWLSIPLPFSPEDRSPVIVPAGIQVASRASDEEREVIFTTDRKLTIIPPSLTQLRREQDFNKNYLPRLGVELFYPFDQQKPAQGDTFYLGFDELQDISGHILQLRFETRPTEAVGVRREDPPWVWECSTGEGTWEEIPLSTRQGEKDTTGGLNNAEGRLHIYLPLGMRPDTVHGRSAYWVRCRLEQRRETQGMYTESPRVVSVESYSIGAAVSATHAVVVENEMLGTSNGEPAQKAVLQHAPLLDLQEDETIEVEETQFGDVVYVPWQYVKDFSKSERYDRHFTLDLASGQLDFGPAIRQPDGTIRQYGRVPESGRNIKFKRYRFGGGVTGNVPAERLTGLTTALAYISTVSNLRRASGGRDQETLEELKARARREIQAQMRAVTAEDYEQMTLAATRSVARVKCSTPQANSSLAPGVVDILVVPAAADSLKAGDLTRLQVDEALKKVITSFLDKYRLLSTILRVREPEYLGVKVKAKIVPAELSRPEVVRVRVLEQLRVFLSPLAIGQASGEGNDLFPPDWQGWPFGKDLFIAEIFSLIQRVPGVRYVVDVEVSTRPVVPSEEIPPEEEAGYVGLQKNLTPVADRVIQVADDALICSLDHDVVITSLTELYDKNGK